jgi:peptidoglycan hydrolase CwlO-like protein
MQGPRKLKKKLRKLKKKQKKLKKKQRKLKKKQRRLEKNRRKLRPLMITLTLEKGIASISKNLPVVDRLQIASRKQMLTTIA